MKELRKHLGEVFRRLAEQKGCRIEEGHLMRDHVHMMMAIRRIFGIAGDGLYQGEECNSSGASVWREEA